VVRNNPKSEGMSIIELISNVDRGDIKIPKFQRKYVWKQKDIIALLDSLYRGYPIGSLLFWRTTSKLKGERNIGGYNLKDTAESYPTNYVLDGQQRLTTIYSVFTDRNGHTGMSEIFDISFELHSEKFVPTKQASPESIPLHSLFDNLVFQLIMRNSEFNFDLIHKASDLQRTFMSYQIPVVTIFDMEIDEVSTIFERINSEGKTLTTFDLMVAATWSESLDLRDEIDDINANLEDKNYDGLSEITILKCLAVIMTGGQNKSAIFSIRDMITDIKIGMQKTRKGLYKAIDFLSTELSVPSQAFLPYDFQVILLTYFFANITSPTKEILDSLKKWFWKSSFSERYQGANDTLLDSDIKDCEKLIRGNNDVFDFPLDISVTKIMKSEFRKGTAFSNALIALLSSQRPRNLLTGVYIDVDDALSSYNRKEFHHIFPVAFLKSKKVQNNSNSVCNIVILSSQTNKKISAKAPSSYFKDVQKTLGIDYEAVLNSNLLPTDDLNGIEHDDYDFFLENRAELLLEKIRGLV
jgi:hypothetical protein